MKKRCSRVHNEEEQLIEKKERKQGKLELNDPKDQRKKYSLIPCFAVFTWMHATKFLFCLLAHL